MEIYPKFQKWRAINDELWFAFESALKELPPIDFILANGDLIEGKGKRSGGTELLTPDRNLQCSMAVSVFDHLKPYCNPAVEIIGTYGTPYHAGEYEDWEDQIAKTVGFRKMGSHEWYEVNGLVFDLKHAVGSSQVPYSRHTATAKEGTWNDIWAIEDMQPFADVILRSHVHYFQYSGNSRRLQMTLPALQGMGSKFGARKCSGLVDFGFIFFEIHGKNKYQWYPFIIPIKAQKAKVVSYGGDK